jgi:hypothetical protein
MAVGNRGWPRNIPGTAVICMIAVILLIPAFYSNFYRTSPPKTFSSVGRRSENLILGRVVYSRDNGLFSKGGIPGRCIPKDEKLKNDHELRGEFQYRAYLEKLAYEDFIPHRSQLGFQAHYLSLIDKIPWFSNEVKLKLFYLVNALLFVIVLCLILVWASRNFGLMTSMVLLLSLLFSLWIVAFGRNLWFAMWAFYLPMATVMLILQKEVKTGKDYGPLLYAAVFVTILLKLLFTSYEFVTSSLVMVFVPLVYFWFRYDWHWKKSIIRIIKMGTVCVLALLISMVVLAFQIKSIDGSFSDGVRYIAYSFNKRALGDPEKVYKDMAKMPDTDESLKSQEIYMKSLTSSMSEVIGIYLKKDFLDLRPLAGFSRIGTIPLKLSYLGLILIFAMISLAGELLCRLSRLESLAKKNLRALNLAFLASFAGPLSWFIIFKGHSYIHNSLDMLAWHMPMVLFGMMLTGFFVKLALSLARR